MSSACPIISRSVACFILTLFLPSWQIVRNCGSLWNGRTHSLSFWCHAASPLICVTFGWRYIRNTSQVTYSIRLWHAIRHLTTKLSHLSNFLSLCHGTTLSHCPTSSLMTQDVCSEASFELKCVTKLHKKLHSSSTFFANLFCHLWARSRDTDTSIRQSITSYNSDSVLSSSLTNYTKHCINDSAYSSVR